MLIEFETLGDAVDWYYDENTVNIVKVIVKGVKWRLGWKLGRVEIAQIKEVA